MKNLIFAAGVLLFGLPIVAQEQPFEIALEPIVVPELGGLQSYAFGIHDGKWLILGGRLDGLHRRQPWATFDEAGHNNQIIVIDPVAQRKWTAPLFSLSIAMQEQLSSTNMEFYQDGDYLYCMGGYGYSKTEGQHTTYDKLTAIHVGNVIDAVINNGDIATHFRQYSHPDFQVSGGKLKKINEVYHILGGQLFIGAYNPMGPNNGSGFIQEYTNAIRRFRLTDDGVNLEIQHLEPFVDADNLHRRDYNAEPQILPNGEQGITMFSGVFQYNVNLPFLDAVTVDAQQYVVNSNFQQLLNHYHCPALPLYSAVNNEMHTVFFGGIAQFYMDGDQLIQDDEVPFVTTIARVTRTADGVMKEFKMPIEMPGLLGAGAEFIPNLDLPHYSNKVFHLDSLTDTPTHIGYIFGGINSSQPNIFFINDGTQSIASSIIYKVSIKNNGAIFSSRLDKNVNGDQLQLVVFPNPGKDSITFNYFLDRAQDVKITITDLTGRVIEQVNLSHQGSGHQTFATNLKEKVSPGAFLVTVETEYARATQKFILR